MSLFKNIFYPFEGYWKDDALLKLIPKGPRRSPIIHAGYYCRYRIINDLYRRVLAGGFNQVVVLGAGSDTTYWRLEIFKRPEIKWFEIDFPKNLEFKSKCLKNSEQECHNYVPVPGDLRNMEAVHESLVDKDWVFNFNKLY